MATLTSVDLANASKYAMQKHTARTIGKWRKKFPNIFIDWSVRAAHNDDYYVPHKLRDKAVVVDLKFSEEGCNQISCYPFTETNPIDVYTEFDYTQTSDTPVGYAQPACYNLDPAKARKEGKDAELQSLESRYFNNSCILVDTLAKMWFNTPYVRTDNHTTKGIDDVSGFNVAPRNDAFPESFVGSYNTAYCNRFGRDLINNRCSFQWWESMIGFVLGESIYTTFKMLFNDSAKIPSTVDYKKPSHLLPKKPDVDAKQILHDWSTARDSTVDVEYEQTLNTFATLSDLKLSSDTIAVYIANKGLTFENNPQKQRVTGGRTLLFTDNVNNFHKSDISLEDIISEFFSDNSLLTSILVDIGFEALNEAFKKLMKKISVQLIPHLTKLLTKLAAGVSQKLFGETIKSVIFFQLNRFAIKIVSAVAKALARAAVYASSIIGIALAFLSILDIFMSFFDVNGYNNLFPPEYLTDVALSFLEGFYANNQSRSLIELTPLHFADHLTEYENDEDTIEDFQNLLEYVASLDINSNGQMLEFEMSPVIHDFDEQSLAAIALGRLNAYTKQDFEEYIGDFNEFLEPDNLLYNNTIIVAAALHCAMLTFALHFQYVVWIIFLIILLLFGYILHQYKNVIHFYRRIAV